MTETATASSFSIIIPTFQAGDSLGVTLECLTKADPIPEIPIPEIIVSDGGSTDATLTTAKNAGAVIVSGSQGRGAQLKAGADAATGDWLLFLHADTQLPTDWEKAIQSFIKCNPDKAGYFEFTLDSRSPSALRLEKMVKWRCRYFALPYGDQGLLISRDHYNLIGGFKPLPLMEDVDIIRRIGKKKLSPIGIPAITSAKRYEQTGYLRRSIKNLFCLSLYFLGVAPKTIERIYR